MWLISLFELCGKTYLVTQKMQLRELRVLKRKRVIKKSKQKRNRKVTIIKSFFLTLTNGFIDDLIDPSEQVGNSTPGEGVLMNEGNKLPSHLSSFKGRFKSELPAISKNRSYTDIAKHDDSGSGAVDDSKLNFSTSKFELFKIRVYYQT